MRKALRVFLLCPETEEEAGALRPSAAPGIADSFAFLFVSQTFHPTRSTLTSAHAAGATETGELPASEPEELEPVLGAQS